MGNNEILGTEIRLVMNLYRAKTRNQVEFQLPEEPKAKVRMR